MDRPHARPRVIVSRCLEFDSCRWNGLRVSCELVRRLRPYADFFPVCPEVGIGLGVPRDPICLRLRGGVPRLVQPSTGRDLTEEMSAYAQRLLDDLAPVDGVLLKSRSPSCGLWDVPLYPAAEGAEPLALGSGAFAREVLARWSHLPIEDEARLADARPREHYLTRLFTLASFREARAEATAGALVAWHARAKLLLMAYDEVALRAMGRIVAGHGGRPIAEVWADYAAHLHAALACPPQPGPTVNALQHALGYFAGDITPDERARFLSSLEAFRRGEAPLGAPLAIICDWLSRFDEPYLRRQMLFRPYPEALAQPPEAEAKSDL